jgi:hypothetical protein
LVRTPNPLLSDKRDYRIAPPDRAAHCKTRNKSKMKAF